LQDCQWLSVTADEICNNTCLANFGEIPEIQRDMFALPLIRRMFPPMRCTILSGAVFAAQMGLSADSGFGSRKLLQEVCAACAPA
jgi:hypothetical protein